MKFRSRKAAQNAARPFCRVFGATSFAAPLYEVQFCEGYLGKTIVIRAVRTVAEAPLVGGQGDDLAEARLAAVVAGMRGVQNDRELGSTLLPRARGEYGQARRWVQAFGVRVRCLTQ